MTLGGVFMKKHYPNFLLYITKKGDTLESIAQQFHISTEEIHQHNKIIRYHSIFPGMPLHILTKEKEEKNKDTRFMNTAFFSGEAIYNFCWYMRSCYISSLFIPNDMELSVKLSKKSLHAIFESIQNDSPFLKELETYISYLHSSSLTLATCIQKQKMEVCKNEIEVKKEKKKKYKEYLIQKYPNFESIISLLDPIDDMWQIFVFSFAGNQFEKGEDTFSKIQEKEISFYQSLTHQLFQSI